MEISTKQASDFRPTISKFVTAFAFASVMGGMAMTSALGRDNDRHDGHEDRDRHGDNDRHGDSGWHGDNGRHGWHGDRDRRDYEPEYRPVYQHPYVYSQPVYVPAPAYYPPPPSPGISLFFPLDIRIR